MLAISLPFSTLLAGVLLCYAAAKYIQAAQSILDAKPRYFIDKGGIFNGATDGSDNAADWINDRVDNIGDGITAVIYKRGTDPFVAAPLLRRSPMLVLPEDAGKLPRPGQKRDEQPYEGVHLNRRSQHPGQGAGGAMPTPDLIAGPQQGGGGGHPPKRHGHKHKHKQRHHVPGHHGHQGHHGGAARATAPTLGLEAGAGGGYAPGEPHIMAPTNGGVPSPALGGGEEDGAGEVAPAA